MIPAPETSKQEIQTPCELNPTAGDAGRPFVKYVGGKRQLLPELMKHVPEKLCGDARYFEPFVGGGALFFSGALGCEASTLSDTNERLIRTYKGIRDDVDGVIRLLKTYSYDSEFFYKIRAMEIDKGLDNDVAAWFIYLNKTCFNGLYRVNRKNGFNVPFGSYTNPTICDEANLRACSRDLQGVKLLVADFESVVAYEPAVGAPTAGAKAGDFVYFDPPYVPLSATSSFTGYTSVGFGLEDQTRLRDAALTLKKRGVHVLLSNSSAPLVRELYSDGFEIHEVSATRSINSKAEGRGAIKELVMT